jgi:hypothetical protein
MAITRTSVAAICSVLMATGGWAGQDSAARVLTSNDIKANIGTDADARSVVAQVLTHFMINHERREFFLASQIPAEWLPSISGVEFVRLADAEIVGHTSACGRYWIFSNVERADSVVRMKLSQRCGGTTMDYIASFEGNQWRLGPPGGGSWVPGVGSGFVGGPPADCRCR